MLYTCRIMGKLSFEVTKIDCHLPWTPALDDASKKSLLGVVGNIWAKRIDNATVMSVAAKHHRRLVHLW